MTGGPHKKLRADDDLGDVVEAHGPLEVEPADDFFRRFVTSILRQQVSMASARAIRERFLDRVECTPEGVLATDDDVLRDCGLSRQKVGYVKNIAEAFVERGYSTEYFEEMDDDEVLAELTSIPGVGDWTAKMQLMFSLGREDVFPVEDLGIRRGMERLYGDVSREEMVERAEQWRPYRSYASRYIWRIEDDVDPTE